MASICGGDLFVQSLKREGVKHIFTLCGGHINPIYTACMEQGIDIIDVRHEQVATHAAAGWARATGEPGVAVITAGPGVTDAVTGVAEAFTAGIPIIVFGGRSPLFDFDRGALQDIDQVRLMEPITKWARAVYEVQRIPEYVSTALRIATSDTPGPVYLECPFDILMEQVDDTGAILPQKYVSPTQGGGSPTQITEAVKLLANADRPAVVAGDGIFWSKADQELKEFVELGQFPVRTTGLAQGAIPSDHPLALGHPATAMADVVLALGVRFDFLEGYGQTPLFDANAKIIQVHNDASTIGYNRSADIGITGNPKTVLKQMIDEVNKSQQQKDRSEWIEQLKLLGEMLKSQAEPAYASDSLPIHPGRLAREVIEFLDDDALAIVDGGDCSGWFAPAFKSRFMGQLLATGPFGCLGVGTGFALAAKLAKPDKQVLGYFGDGAFGLNAMEFDTFVRHNLPIVAVISNDGAWGMVKHWQKMTCSEDKCTGMTLKAQQRYDKMVEALGGYGEYVERVEDIKPALKRAFDSGLPACINVEVDPNAVSDTTHWLYQSLLGSTE
jgi:acetolactate synthase-1/2/3 large subunit